jgi:hypothetical protein
MVLSQRRQITSTLVTVSPMSYGGELFIRVIWIGATFVFRFCKFNIYWVLRPFMVAISFFFFLLLADRAKFFVFFLLR